MRVAPPSVAPLKYVVGIAIAKATFVACFGRIDLSQSLSFGKETTFANTAAGFAALLVWTAKQQKVAAPQWFVVEAMGVYDEERAYFLADNGQALNVLLPNKVKHFAQSTEQKRKTDQLDARLRCRLGLERALPAWHPPTPALRQLRVLSRERQNLTQQAVRLKAQRHAYQHSYQPDARTLGPVGNSAATTCSAIKSDRPRPGRATCCRASIGSQAGAPDQCARHRPHHGYGGGR